MCMNQLPPTHHRDAEHLREELESIQRLIMLCVDALQLASVPELSHVTETLYELQDRVWNNIAPAKALETVLYEEWLAKIEAEKASQREAKGGKQS